MMGRDFAGSLLRGILFGAVIVGLAYLGVGPVVGFGIVILIAVVLGASDTQDHIKKLAMHLDDYIVRSRDDPRGAAETKDALANMGRELETISTQLRSMDIEIQMLRQSLSKEHLGPWKA